MKRRRASAKPPTLTVVGATERTLAEIWAIAERLVGSEGLDEAYLDVGDHREAQKFEHGLEAGTGCARG